MTQTIVLTAIVLLFSASLRSKVELSASFLSSVASWGLVPPRFVRLTASSIALAEAATVGGALSALAMPSVATWAVGAAAALLAAFTVAQLAIMRASKRADCGCFGTPMRVGAATIVRTSALSAVFGFGWWLQV
jgi:hypothetical protein